jgi:hypothetical protein
MQSSLSPNTLNALRALLEAKRREVLFAISATGAYGPREAPSCRRPDALDVAGVGAGGGAFLSQACLLRDFLGAIVEAQRRLERGTYGVCADCGKPIPLTRLLIVPWAVRHVECTDRHRPLAPAGQRSVGTRSRALASR